MTETRVCNKHGEYSAEIVTVFGRIFASACPVCTEEAEKAEKLKAQEMQKNVLISRGIEPEFFGATLEGYMAENESEKQALQACRDLLAGKIKKLLLLGSNGVGKTHLGNAVAIKAGGVVTTMYAISAKIRQGYNNGSGELDVLDELLSYPLIVIDEIGRTKGSDSERNWQSYLIDKAHVRGIKLLLISNRQLARTLSADKKGEAFEYYMDNDVISRIRQNSRIIEIHGRDRRSSN